MKKAFTLAEIMIALTVIGVITSILLPVAFQTTPDENIMKFKKGNATLAKVINELVSSNKDYKDGDLGTKADGTVLYGFENSKICLELLNSNGENKEYFCETFADLVNVKRKNCSSLALSGVSSWTLNKNESFVPDETPSKVSKEMIIKAKEKIDEACMGAVEKGMECEIITNDNICYYQTAPNFAFGTMAGSNKDKKCYRVFSPPNETPYLHDENNMDVAYKIFCMDVDGINQGEAPFGYGIRADGKILTGARADKWLEKSLQDKD